MDSMKPLKLACESYTYFSELLFGRKCGGKGSFHNQNYKKSLTASVVVVIQIIKDLIKGTLPQPISSA